MTMKKTAGIIGIILATLFLVLGFISVTPDKYIKSYGDNKMYEYVGGDAYNYIIEASLRGGEIAGAKTAKAVYFVAAGILFVLSLSFLTTDEGKDEIRNDIGSVKNEIKDARASTSKQVENVTSLQKEQLESLKKLVEHQEKNVPKESEDRNEDNRIMKE